MNIFERIAKTFNRKEKGLSETLNIGGDNAIDLFLLGKNRPTNYTKGQALTLYEQSLYLNKAIEKRAEKVSQIELFLKKGDEEIYEHEILNNLAKPNELQTWEQFSALWSKWYDIYGEVYIYIEKEKDLIGNSSFKLYLLDPSICEPKFSGAGELEEIRYQNKETYQAEDIIYDYRPDPRNQLRGVSLIQAGYYAIDNSIGLEKLNNSLIRSGGKVEGIINFKNEMLTEQQLEIFRESYKGDLEKMNETGNVVFLGGDANYQRINLSPEEMGYSNSKKLTLNDICILTDVPKVLLNSVDEIKYGNAEVSLRIFLSETIFPLVKRQINKLNEKLEIIPEEYELMFIDNTPEDKEYKLKLNENGAKNYFMTINEMRANVGLEPIKSGDQILTPFTLIGKDPNDPNSYNEPEATQEQEKRFKSKNDITHPLRNEVVRRAYFKSKNAEIDSKAKVFLKELKNYLKKQEKTITDYLEAGEVKGKKKGLLDNIFNMKEQVNLGFSMLAPVLKKFLEEAARDSKKLVGSDYDFIWTDEIESTLNKRIELFLKSINETTFNKLKEQLSEGLEEGENYRGLSDRVMEIYGDIKTSRANTIARTEVHTAINTGTMAGYKQAGMPIKIWVSVMDDKTRDSHAYLDGQERPIDVPFSNGLMYPGDPVGEAGEVINCRCVV